MTDRSARTRIAAACVGSGVLLVCVVYIARNFQWRDALGILANADCVRFVLGGSAAIVGFWLVRAFRWRFLMRGMRADAAFVDLYLCSSVALSLSVFTPLQSGEALKVELLKRYGGLARLPGYGAFLIERVADLYVVVAVGFVALAASLGSPAHAMALAAVLAAAPIAAYAAMHRLRLPGLVGAFAEQLQGGLGTPARLLGLLLLTILGWAIVALGWQACLLSVSIDLGLADLLGLVSAVTLASIASFIPGGLGIAEAGSAEILLRYGTGAPLAQAGALMLRAFSLLVIALGTVHWFLLRARRRGPS